MLQTIRCASFVLVMTLLASRAAAEPTLSLSVVGGSGYVELGETVTMALSMSDLAAFEATGYQAFLRYDPTQLQFVQGNYTAAPFGLHILMITPQIEGPYAILNLAAGIDQFNGQTPTSADASLALIEFQALVLLCDVPSLEFRTHQPPTRITNNQGNPTGRLLLVSLPLPCPQDFDNNGVINLSDLLAVINNWGTCDDQAICCLGDCTGEGDVNANDLLQVINNWGPCPQSQP